MEQKQVLLPKPPKMRKLKTKFLSWVLILILILLGIIVWAQVCLPLDSNNKAQKAFFIERGHGLFDISSNLKEEGIIRSKTLFNLAAILKGVNNQLQAGVYMLSPSMSISQILNKVSVGDIVKKNITIIEGWSLKEIAWYFEGKGLFQAEELFEITGFPAVDYSNNQELPTVKDFSNKFGFLKEKPANVSLEGYLFPDTYEVVPGDSIEGVVKKMLANFEDKINQELQSAIKNQGRTLFEVLTMASILEKEVRGYENKQIAAGLLWKRLRSGWPLQVDATLTYLTGKPSESLTQKDLEIDSPYNTYKHYGLPLGSICNPGLESIKAAVYYKESPYWFYLTTPEGQTVFSVTLADHAFHKSQYLK